jgi:sensor c-di-GMP phosphodiesterase-like protein
MSTGEVLGTEVLTRWKHQERGIVQSADFLPMIENHSISLNMPITRQIAPPIKPNQASMGVSPLKVRSTCEPAEL